jgi:hypothetical protein
MYVPPKVRNLCPFIHWRGHAPPPLQGSRLPCTDHMDCLHPAAMSCIPSDPAIIHASRRCTSLLTPQCRTPSATGLTQRPPHCRHSAQRPVLPAARTSRPWPKTHAWHIAAASEQPPLQCGGTPVSPLPLLQMRLGLVLPEALPAAAPAQPQCPWCQLPSRPRAAPDHHDGAPQRHRPRHRPRRRQDHCRWGRFHQVRRGAARHLGLCWKGMPLPLPPPGAPAPPARHRMTARQTLPRPSSAPRRPAACSCQPP